MQIVVDMDGGAYVLGDLMAMLGHHPGDSLEVSVEGNRLVISTPTPRMEPNLAAMA